MNDRREKSKCPECGGDLVFENGKIECVKCDYKKDEQRKKTSDEYNEWLQ
uniref:Uncharacterized protein n=1 Tax=viral metagenome TaxID=1070528 RepID=A0A6M3JZG8_9ZZZZ